MEWATIDGHYWLELRINPSKRAGTLRNNMQKTLSKKLKRILESANIKVTEKFMKSITMDGRLATDEDAKREDNNNI